MINEEIIFDEEIINKAYRPFFHSWNRIVVLWGGGGSGKSVAAVQTCIIRMMAYEAYNGLVCKQVHNSIKYTIFSEFRRWINEWGINKYFHITDTPMRIICKRTGSEFRFKGMQDVSNIKSFIYQTGPIVCLILEEANQVHLRDFLQMNNIRMRGETVLPKQTIVIFNPDDSESWLKKIFFDEPMDEVYHAEHDATDCEKIDMRTNDLDGPVARKGYGVYTLYTTHKDNRHYGKEEIKSLLQVADIDPGLANVYIGTDEPERRWGNIGSSQIFTNCEIYNFKKMPDGQIRQGMDFGYHNLFYFERSSIRGNELFVFNSVSGTELDPLEKLGIVDWMGDYDQFLEDYPKYYRIIEIYYRQLKLKKPKYTPLIKFCEILSQMKIDKNERLIEIILRCNKIKKCWTIADSTDMSTIELFRKNGYKIKPAKKGPGSVMAGIGYLKQFQRIHINRAKCPVAAKEVRMYRWRVDANTGKIMDEPIDRYNHTWDSRRYAHEDSIFSKMRNIEVY